MIVEIAKHYAKLKEEIKKRVEELLKPSEEKVE